MEHPNITILALEIHPSLDVNPNTQNLDRKSLLIWSKSKQADIWLFLPLQCVIFNSILTMHNK